MRNGVVVGLGGQICVWYAYRTVLPVSSMACVQYGVCPYGVCPYGVRRLLDVAEPLMCDKAVLMAGELHCGHTAPGRHIPHHLHSGQTRGHCLPQSHRILLCVAANAAVGIKLTQITGERSD